MREVERYAESTTEAARHYLRVVMSDKARESKIDVANLKLLRNLEQREAVEICHIPREKFTGGAYRKKLIERADAMLAIGGGKGTYSIGADMTDLGKPVLPLDLRLGSISEDGGGAVDLYKEMMSDSSRFFPSTPDVINRIGLISLNREINGVDGAAQAAAEMIEDATQAGWGANAKRGLAAVWQSAKALPLISAAIKIVESIFRLLT